MIMKIFLSILILVFSLQSWTKAEDIRDFEIEGMSIGDSLLDYFTLAQIENSNKNTYPNSNKFVGVELPVSNYEKYKFVQIHYDHKYVITSVAGAIFYKNIEECYIQQKDIKNQFKLLFKNAKIHEGKFEHPQDQSGKSFLTSVEFSLVNGDALIHCTDWSKNFENNGYGDNLRVEISTKEFSDFLRNDAF